jgi:hypothetical protein
MRPSSFCFGLQTRMSAWLIASNSSCLTPKNQNKGGWRGAEDTPPVSAPWRCLPCNRAIAGPYANGDPMRMDMPERDRLASVVLKARSSRGVVARIAIPQN